MSFYSKQCNIKPLWEIVCSSFIFGQKARFFTDAVPETLFKKDGQMTLNQALCRRITKN